MEGMDRKIEKKKFLSRKVVWIWIIGIAISIFSYTIVLCNKASKFYVGNNKQVLKDKK